jgi:hypothetical protein
MKIKKEVLRICKQFGKRWREYEKESNNQIIPLSRALTEKLIFVQLVTKAEGIHYKQLEKFREESTL